MTDNRKEIKISVRNLVEFIIRSGDIDNTRSGKNDIEAMQAGSRIHRKLQKQMGANYSPEVPLGKCSCGYDDMVFDLTVKAGLMVFLLMIPLKRTIFQFLY